MMEKNSKMHAINQICPERHFQFYQNYDSWTTIISRKIAN